MRNDLANAPWFVYLLSAVLSVGAAEFGRFLGLRWARRQRDALAADITTLEAAGLSLLALMIGFTFAMTLSRFDARLKGVLDEANAIGTAGLRAQMLPEPHAEQVRALLRDYVQLRLDFAAGSGDQASFERAVRRSKQIQTELWRHAVAVSNADTRSVPAGLFAASLNQMIDLQEVRLAAGRNRLPPAVLVLLCGIAVVTVGFSSYVGGVSGKAGRVPHALMAILVAAVIGMVADIDRSRTGFITVSQYALETVRADLGP